MMQVKCSLYNPEGRYDWTVSVEVDDNISTNDLVGLLWRGISPLNKNTWFPIITSDIYKLIKWAYMGGGFSKMSWLELDIIPLD